VSLCLSVEFIALRSHDEIVLMQAFYDMRPKLKLQIASIPKIW
jgi:hypothetical protein